MGEFFSLKIEQNPWMVVPLIILVTAAFGLIANHVILKAFKRWGKRIPTALDDEVYRLLERYLFPLLMVGGLLVITDMAPLAPAALRAIRVLLVISAVLLMVLLSIQTTLLLLDKVETRYAPLRSVKGPIEIVIKVVVVTVGGLFILDNLGVSITPLITTLGIGTLAVAIALQDTLGNIFAGLYIKADCPVTPGQYVRLESGEEGYVDRVGWRSTRIRMLPNNMVVVPNTKIVQGIIVNYHLPERELAVLVEVGVHYESDLEKVESVTCEVAKEVLETVSGGVSSFAPFIRYHTFNQSSIDFTVILRAREFTDRFLLKHEFIKRLHARYRIDGITIPSPIRTIYVKAERESLAARSNRDSRSLASPTLAGGH